MAFLYLICSWRIARPGIWALPHSAASSADRTKAWLLWGLPLGVIWLIGLIAGDGVQRGTDSLCAFVLLGLSVHALWNFRPGECSSGVREPRPPDPEAMLLVGNPLQLARLDSERRYRIRRLTIPSARVAHFDSTLAELAKADGIAALGVSLPAVEALENAFRGLRSLADDQADRLLEMAEALEKVQRTKDELEAEVARLDKLRERLELALRIARSEPGPDERPAREMVASR